MEIKIRSERGYLPAYETDGSAGMDLRAALKEPVSLEPGERTPEAALQSSVVSVLSTASAPSTAITGERSK